MSIIDKFLDVMRLNDDDYEFDNEDYDYDEEEDYEVKEKKPSRRERKKEEEQQQTAATFDISEKQRQKQQNKITPINRNRRQGQPGMERSMVLRTIAALPDICRTGRRRSGQLPYMVRWENDRCRKRHTA